MNVLPLYNRIIVEPIIENTTESGLIYCHPDLVTDQMRKGIVLYVGPECKEIKQGQTIMYEKHRGVALEIFKKKHLEIREWDVEAILEKL